MNSTIQVLIGPQKPSGYTTDGGHTDHVFKKKKGDSFLIINFISYKNIAQKSGYTEVDKYCSQ